MKISDNEILVEKKSIELSISFITENNNLKDLMKAS